MFDIVIKFLLVKKEDFLFSILFIFLEYIDIWCMGLIIIMLDFV